MPLRGYPKYEASDQGRIRHIKSGAVLAVSQSGRERPHVGLMLGGVQVKRGLSLLICNTFIDPPRLDFNTPIHLDGDLMNCRVSNLAWRPRWFAMRHTAQFGRNPGNSGQVRNINTGIVYGDVWDVVTTFGLLYNDVVIAIINKTYVFPLMHCFEWVDPH